VEFFDSFAIPYTFTLGNHDGEFESSAVIAAYYATGNYSWFDRGPGSIHGFSNSAINLVNSAGKVIYSMILIDTNIKRYNLDGSYWYDYVYPDQAQWYQWVVNGVNTYQGSPVKSLLFYHIPLPEIDDLRAEWTQIDPAAANDAFRQDACPSYQNSTFWQVVKDTNSSTHMFFGHDHPNLMDYVYQGVHWVYGLKTGTSMGAAPDRIGGTLITVGQDSSVKIEFIYELDVPDSPRADEFINGKRGKRLQMPKE
jgi:hypothetical protein